MMYVMVFAIGIIFGAVLSCVPIMVTKKIRAEDKNKSITQKPPDINERKDIMRQWDNLLNYDGNIQKGGARNED